MPIKIIAEIGHNHNGDMGLARELISAAASSGAHIAKFQLFDAKKLFSRVGNPWYEYNLSTELSQMQTSELASFCESQNIEFMASAFDVERLMWLENLNVKAHKLASRSLNDKTLIVKMLETQKPLLVSLGMWHGEEFPPWCVSQQTYFLHCISEYPAPYEKLRLASIDFSKYSGFSDHSIGIQAACIAIARGAQIVEKHFTLDKDLFGPDHQGSMEPDELRQLVQFTQSVEKCL